MSLRLFFDENLRSSFGASGYDHSSFDRAPCADFLFTMFLIHRCSLFTSFSLFGIFSSTEADESFVRTFSSSGFSTTGPSSSLDSRFLLLSQVLRGFHSSLSFDDHTPCASPERASSKLLLSIAAHAPLTHSTRAFGMQRLFGRPESTFFFMADFRHERCSSSQDLRLFSLRCSGDFTTRSLFTDHCTSRESLAQCLVILCCGSCLTSFLLSELLAN